MKIYTELFDAIENEDIDKVKLLIQQDIDINHQDYNGNTALHRAVDISIDGTIQTGGKLGDEPLETIQLLMASGANIDLKNSDGKTALDWAKDYKSKKVVSVFEQENS